MLTCLYWLCMLYSGMKCSDCGYNAHEKCVPQVPKQCSRRGSTKDHGNIPARHPAPKEDSNSAHTPTTDSGTSYSEGKKRVFLCCNIVMERAWHCKHVLTLKQKFIFIPRSIFRTMTQHLLVLESYAFVSQGSSYLICMDSCTEMYA